MTTGFQESQSRLNKVTGSARMKRDEELVDLVVTRILIEARVAAIIDFVEDQNSANSTKNTEITKRGRDGERVINITNGQQFRSHQWRKFIENGSYKTGLLNFFVR